VGLSAMLYCEPGWYVKVHNCRTFLLLNGYDFTADEPTRLQVWMNIGDGSMSEPELTDWLRPNIIRKVAD
jgi:prophage maintenance system killer protein